MSEDAAPPPRHDPPKGGAGRAVARILRGLAILLGVLLPVAAGGAYLYIERAKAPGPLAAETVVVVPKGTGVRGIADLLIDAGAVEDRYLFLLANRLFFADGSLKAGEYRFPAGASIVDILARLDSHDVVLRTLTVPEGLTSVEILAVLAAAEGLTGPVGDPPPEGNLLPETYAYSHGDSRADVLERMRRSMRDVLAREWEARAPGLPLKTPEEAVTLASIVEKETGVAAERGKVAGVFINRLNRGMRLQSDPTVIFALTDGKAPLGRALTRADWRVEHPYNTYRIDGLPPGPIAHPGLASLRAVLQPEATTALFFVADGTGGHVFADTLEQHNRNVRAWRRIRDGTGN